MFNIIRSELYKTRHRKYPYILIGILSAFILFFVTVTAFQNRVNNANIGLGDVLLACVPLLSMGVYMTILIVDAVFSDEYKNQTMKNTVAFGISRTSLFFGKLIAELSVAVISLIVLLAVLILSTLILMGPGDQMVLQAALPIFFQRVVLCLPLFVGALCVANFLSFTIKSNGVCISVFFIMFTLGAQFCSWLAQLLGPVFLTIRSWLLMPQFDNIVKNTIVFGDVLGKCLIVGLGYAIVATVVGLALFQRREIK